MDSTGMPDFLIFVLQPGVIAIAVGFMVGGLVSRSWKLAFVPSAIIF